jgi:heptosyltransferase-2
MREPFDRILVRAPNPLGDAVMATPLLRAIRESWPRAHVTALCLRNGADMYRGLGTVDDIVVYERKGAHRGAAGMMRLAKSLRKRRFDLAFVCPNSLSSALLARLSGAKRICGWSYGGRGFLLTDPVVPALRKWNKRVPTPMIGYYLDLARHMGAEPLSTATELRIHPEGEEEALRFLGAGGWREGERLAGLGVGASFGPSKLWTPEAFAAVGDALAARGLRPVLVHGPGEEPVAAAVQERMKARPALAAGAIPTLAGLKSIIRRLAVLVTTDTGPRHVAVALGVPVVVIMGPTAPEYTACNLERTEVLRHEVDCAPYSWPCQRKECPLEDGRRMQCMTGIAPARAVEAALRLVERWGGTTT